MRVNFLIPELGTEYLFGGRLAELNLALRLSRHGFRVRLITVDHSPLPRPSTFQRFEGLKGLVATVEIEPAFGRGAAVEVSSRDTFIASTWWAAHIADAAVRSLGEPFFLYLVQEYDFFAVPRGPYAALAEEAYRFPHRALFSTELLRAFFERRRLGVFSGERPMPDDVLTFRNAITPVPAPSTADLAGRSPRRLLMYARPETHAERNLFEIAMHGLSRAVATGAFRGEWEFIGIGKQGLPLTLEWGGVSLRMLPRTTQSDYASLLRTCDLGLALQYSPHPGLVPLEMASAGMVVVTNEFETKTPEALREISTNILAVEPTIAGVDRGLRESVRRLDDHETRVSAARIDWPRTWDEAFPPPLIERISDVVRAPRR